MATQHQIVGEEWKQRATELAEWTMLKLVNRKDVWGQYSVLTPSEQRREDKSYKAMTLPQKSRRGADMVTLDKLTRHFASRRHNKPQIIGLHATSKEGTSKWMGIDIDCHDTDATAAEDHARRNLVTAIDWWQHLQSLGYDPLLFDSSGAGGYHLWVLFAEPAPTTDVYAFAKTLVSRWQRDNLDEEPETFPKRFKEGSLGSWFRIPGLHHTRDHYSSVWSGDDWLSDPWLHGHAAIDAIVLNLPGPPPPKADTAESSTLTDSRVTRRSRRASSSASVDSPAATAVNRRRNFPRSGDATVCVDLDGVLCSRRYSGTVRQFGDPVDGAREFMQELAGYAKIVIFTARLGTESDDERVALAELVAQWLAENGITYHEICTDRAKPVAHAYVDDRAVSCRPERDGVQAFENASEQIKALCNDSLRV